MTFWFVVISFIIGVGAGAVWSRSRRGDEINLNPFLRLDRTEADELRAEGAAAVQARVERRKARIMAKAEADGRITNDGVEDLFCISDTTAGRYLGILVDEGKLRKVGTTGRGVYYEPK